MSNSGLLLSWLVLFKISLAAIALFLLFGFVKTLLRKVSRSRPAGAHVLRYIPLAEGLVWLYFALWGLQNLLPEPSYQYPLILALLGILLALTAWYTLRDWYMGILLRTQNHFRTGYKLLMEKGISGKISRIGYLSLEVEDDNANTTRIPYSFFGGKVYSLYKNDADGKHYRFSLAVNRNRPEAEQLNRIRMAVLNSPRASLTKEPDIHLSEETPEQFVFTAVVFAPNRLFAQEVEADVRKTLADAVLQPAQ